MTSRPHPLELRIFYAMFAVALTARSEVMVARAGPLTEENFNGLVSVLARWAAGTFAIYPLAGAAAVLSFGLCLWRPDWRAFRIAAFLSANVFLSLYFSYNGSTWNNYHGFVVTSFLLCFLNGKAAWDFQVFRFAQAAVFTHYALSGSWKLGQYLSAGAFGFDVWLSAPFNALAQAVAEGQGPNTSVMNLAIAYPWILSAGWLAVILFQCSAFLPILKPRLIRVWGIGAIIFHLGTGFFLDIWFPDSIALDLYLFVIYEDWIALGNHPNVQKPKP